MNRRNLIITFYDYLAANFSTNRCFSLINFENFPVFINRFAICREKCDKFFVIPGSYTIRILSILIHGMNCSLRFTIRPIVAKNYGRTVFSTIVVQNLRRSISAILFWWVIF